jgi:glycosyltransferase involved in cell wall biosynthesis
VTAHRPGSPGRPPRVSVGLAVYNGENFVASALESILAQTYSDLEVIVSDNASTDRTPEICRAFALRDSRIRYTRNDANIGSTRNFNRVFGLSRGEYFKWAAHDDLIAPEFLHECVAELDAHPDVVLCHTRTSIIDAQGNITRRHEEEPGTSPVTVHRRFRAQLFDFWCYEIFGLIRSAALSATSLIGVYGHGEAILLAKLSLMGRFHRLPGYMFYNRDHPAKSYYMYSTYRDYTVWLDPTKAGRILFPRWRMGIEYIRAIGSSSLGWPDRLLCYGAMVIWARVFWKSLAANVAIALRDAGRILLSPVHRRRRDRGHAGQEIHNENRQNAL